MSREVITVTGPVDPAVLGITAIHEHALADGHSYLLSPDERPAAYAAAAEGELALANLGHVRRQFDLNRHNLVVDDPALVEAELAEFRAGGGRTIVDMSTPGLRVDATALPDISRRSDVLIVTGTGLYIAASRPERFAAMDIDQLAEWMIGEIEVGIDDSGVRAGQIGEVGITDLDDADRRLLRAAVRAAGETGVSISIHPGFEPGTDGRAIADVLESEGGRSERIVIGHGDAFIVESSLEKLIEDPSSWALRLDYHRELFARGYNVSFDCFGHDWGRDREGWVIETDWQRLAALVALIREGYADQLLVSCDVFMRCLHRRGGGLGYVHLLDWVLPKLREHGVAEETITKLTVTNPARILARDTGR
jgi:phosphotriesterase-related protein